VSSKAKKPKSRKTRNGPSLLRPECAALESGVFRVAGVDEAGRGPLAGPVVAAAVMFPHALIQKRRVPRGFGDVTDSKLLAPPRRLELFHALQALPDVLIGVGIVDNREIDRINILNATHLAMRKALEALADLPELAFVDGLPVKGLPCRHEAMVKGDSRCFSIAAASIIAKETRDDLMRELHETYPHYGFARNKGYGTREHRDALEQHGPSPVHRYSFEPVQNCFRLL